MNTNDSVRLFRAGDAVKHLPSDEEWSLAVDQDGEYVYPEGWPESAAKATDCELIESANDELRMETIRRLASLKGVDVSVIGACYVPGGL